MNKYQQKDQGVLSILLWIVLWHIMGCDNADVQIDSYERINTCEDYVNASGKCISQCEACDFDDVVCKTKLCGCLEGEIRCSGNCVLESEKNCGKECKDCTTIGAVCSGGECVCPASKIKCDDLCIDEHDEACGERCDNCTLLGKICKNGQCVCADNKLFCHEKCVSESDQMCGEACTDCTSNGMRCEDGMCVCSSPMIQCADQCLEETDAACGNACFNCQKTGHVCEAGQCVCHHENLSYRTFVGVTELLDVSTLIPTEDIPAIVSENGIETQATNYLPYHHFSIEAGQSYDMVLSWRGTSQSGERLTLFAYSPVDEKWIKLDSDIFGGHEAVELSAVVNTKKYSWDGVVHVIVAPELASNDSDSFLLTGGTQNYVQTKYYENGEPVGIYNVIMEYVKTQYLNHHISYFHHVGNLTLNYSTEGTEQFEREFQLASEAHKIIDDASVPNGMTPGDRDAKGRVSPDGDGHALYDKYFPASRYEGNIWYGGHYDDNWSSYTLVTIAGRDFIFLNIGYGNYPFEWARRVLNLYQHRIAVVCTHDYLMNNGELSKEGQSIYNLFVAPYPNVLMVLSGHSSLAYHIRSVANSMDRKVYEIAVDHSDLYPAPDGKGAEGYLRLITFRDNQVINKTYSPWRDDWRTSEDGASEDWTAELVLPDSVRVVKTLDFKVSTRCACSEDAPCGAEEVCIDGTCVCESGRVMCHGVCLEESDTACGTDCMNCASINGMCRSGECQCLSGKTPVYDLEGKLIRCADTCGDRECGEEAICIDSGSSTRCRCGTDGEICEKGGSCQDRQCACSEELRYDIDANSPVGCMERSEKPSLRPSQITMSIAFNADETRSAMSVNWVTNPETESGELIYATDAALLNPVHVPADVQSVTMDQIIPSVTESIFTPVKAYTAIAADLVPDQIYYYKVGNEVDGYSEIRSFKALSPAASNREFSFVVIPDTQNSVEGSYNTYINDLAYYIKQNEPDIDFFMHLGDFVNHGYHSLEWQYFFHGAKPLLDYKPIMAVVGNHDGGRAYDYNYRHFQTRFNYITLKYRRISSLARDTVYSFEYGNALFLVLNCKAINNDLIEQWNSFITNKTRDTKKKWKIVAIHIPPYSPGNYYNVDNLHGKLLTDAGIDLVISGHEHSYFRTTLHTTGSESGNVEETIRLSPETGAGTTYVIAGTANGGYRAKLDETRDISFNEIDYHSGITRSRQPGMYGKITVTDDYIQYVEYDTLDASIVDKFRIYKTRDEFEAEHQGVIARAGISGMPYIGHELKVIYTPAEAVVEYLWERSVNGYAWTEISGAHESVYLISESDKGAFIRCTIRGKETIKGTVTTLPTRRVTQAK